MKHELYSLERDVRVEGYRNLLAPRNWVLLEKLTVAQPLQKFPAFYETLRFVAVFTTAHHWSLF
jgi:hypothetical protein